MPTALKYITREEYFAMEETAIEKHEFFRGEIFAMSGGTFNHARIGVNTVAALLIKLRGKCCQPTYAYLFIFAKAVRTMHFDNTVTNRIPISKISIEHQSLIDLVDKTLAAKNQNQNTAALEREIDEKVYQLYGLSEDEIKIIEGGK